jgi:hypothetical protein
VQIEMIPIDEVREYEGNPRVNEPAVDGVAASIKQFGFKVPVIVDGDNVLVAGHTRVRAARKLGLTKVPAVRADDLTPEQVRAFRVADNKLHELSSWNIDLLTVELAELKSLDVDLGSLGFSGDELAKLFGNDVTDGCAIPMRSPNRLMKRSRNRAICGYSVNIGCCAVTARWHPMWTGCSTVRRSTWSTPIRRTTSKSSRDRTTPSRQA